MYILHFVYLFFHPSRDIGVALVGSAAMNMDVPVSILVLAFHLIMSILRSSFWTTKVVLELHGNSIFNVFEELPHYI
jgi:hypothetical protein